MEKSSKDSFVVHNVYMSRKLMYTENLIKQKALTTTGEFLPKFRVFKRSCTERHTKAREDNKNTDL